MAITAQDVADQLVARLRVKREYLDNMPHLPALAEQRTRIQGEIDGLSQALAMVRRIG